MNYASGLVSFFEKELHEGNIGKTAKEYLMVGA